MRMNICDHFGWTWSHDYILVVHSDAPPKEFDWQRFKLDRDGALLSSNQPPKGLLALSFWTPTGQLREDVINVTERIPTAVLSKSHLSRVTLSLMALRVKTINGFRPNQAMQALEWLQVPNSDIGDIVSDLKRLSAQVLTEDEFREAWMQ